MASGREKLEDLNMTQDELQRFEKAFKSEEFRKLFAEYAEEISDPENRKRYEAEITAMERERGTDVTFINPEPHYVIKTSLDGEKKCFINICANEHIERPTSQPCVQGEGPSRRMGQTWSVPHSLTPGREDLDKDKQRCMVYDVVFHQETLQKAAADKRFKQMVHDIAFSALERQFQVKLDKTNIKIPKMKYKGNPTATVMRKPSSDGPQATTDNDDDPIKFPYPYSPSSENTETAKQTQSPSKSKEEKEPEKKQDFTVPKYTIKHRSEFDIQNFREAPDAAPSTRPKELVVDIDFPLLKSAAKLELDIFEKQLRVESKKPAYKLDISLPYPVDENKGGAKFDKSKRRLTVTLVVKPAPEADLPFTAGRTEDKQLVEEVTEVQVGEKAEENHIQDGENIIPTGVSEVEPDSRSGNPAAAQTEEIGSGPASDVGVETATDTANTSDKDIFVEEDELQSSSTSLDLPPDSATPVSTAPVRATPAPPTCPDYTFRQDEDSMTIVIHVPNIIEKSISKTYSTSSYIISVQFQAAGTAGLQYYQLFVVLLDGNTVVRGRTSMDVSPHNAVLLLHKDDSCKGLWASFKAGVDIMNLEEKQFLTEASVEAAVQAVVSEGQAEAADTIGVKVTEASEDKLAIELTKTTGVQKQEMGEKPTPTGVTVDEDNLSSQTSSGTSSIKERVSEMIEAGKKGEGLDSDDDDDSGNALGTEAVPEKSVSGNGVESPAETVQDGENVLLKDNDTDVPTGKTKRRRRKKKGKTQGQNQDSNAGGKTGPGTSGEEGGLLEVKEEEERKTDTSSKPAISNQSTNVSQSKKGAATQDTIGFDKTIINTGRERKNSGKKSVTFSDKVEIHKLDEKNGKSKKKQKSKKDNQNAQKVANGHGKTEGEPTTADFGEAIVSEAGTVTGVSNTESMSVSESEDKLAGQDEVGDGDVKKEGSDPAKKKPKPQAVDALTIRDVKTGEEEVVTEHRAECAVQFTNKVMFELD
uniref:Protein kintoun n=1 Tax=Branchiostoma floridae TaxID=7739 RepID=C3Y0J8_BRAFL|eukprot:XP_002610261.1 hypothetical protein BRAFLDRAFT_126826 [Branchiostoma floridae]